ncbi:MAG: fucose isomerase [Pseudomonadota bacterium]
MSKQVVLFCPGDYRHIANDNAQASLKAFADNIANCVTQLGYEPVVLSSFITRPNESVKLLNSYKNKAIPKIALITHWVFATHTCDGLYGDNDPLLLASNFSITKPGLVGLLNTAASLETDQHPSVSRLWSEKADWTTDDSLMKKLAQFLQQGNIDYPNEAVPAALTNSTVASEIAEDIQQNPIISLLFGDTSMGMINGYLGRKIMRQAGFVEHKIDQCWLNDKAPTIEQATIDKAYQWLLDKGVTFHFEEGFDEESIKLQLRYYYSVLDYLEEFDADCMGWQYQLGMCNSAPPSDFSEGLLNSPIGPEGRETPIVCVTEADEGNLIVQEYMKRILQKKKMHPSTFFHDVRGAFAYQNKTHWLLLNSGSAGAYSFNHDPHSLQHVHSYCQVKEYMHYPGGTFAGESLPGEITWARAWMQSGELVIVVGQGEVVKLPTELRDQLWEGSNREWPFMAADLRLSEQQLMAHYLSNHIAVCYGDIKQELIALCQLMRIKCEVWS